MTDRRGGAGLPTDTNGDGLGRAQEVIRADRRWTRRYSHYLRRQLSPYADLPDSMGLQGGLDRLGFTRRPAGEGQPIRRDSRCRHTDPARVLCVVGSTWGADRMTADQAGEDIDERIRALEERARAAETRATMAEEVADRVFTLAGLAQCIRNGSSRTISGAGSLETFSVVIDALAAESEKPRADLVRRMIEDLEERVSLDRAVLVHLYQIEEAGQPGG